MLSHIAEILEAARLAPSRDNLQPWRFVVEGETVSFQVDPTRDRSPLDAAGRLARVALGAALESALIRAGRMGSSVRFREPRAGAVVSVTFSGHKRVPDLDKALARRATNRHEYDGRAVDGETFTALRDAAPVLDTARAHWFGRERVRTLGPIVEDATALLYANDSVRAAMMGALRFDARDREEVTYGLSIGCLELSAPERIALDEIRRASGEGAAAIAAFKKLAARERRLVESASGLCFVSVSGDDPVAEVNAGRTLQRAWVALTRRGLVAQPIAAVAAIEALLAWDERGTLSAAEIERAGAIRDAMRAAVPSVDKGARVAIALRFGWTTGAATSLGRWALQASVEEASNPDDGAEETTLEHPSGKRAAK